MFGLPIPALNVPMLYLKLAGICVAVAAVAFATFQVVHAFDNVRYSHLETQVADARTAGVQHARAQESAQATVSAASEEKEVQAQAHLTWEAKVVHDKVIVHVHDKSPPTGCVTYGLVRVLDAAVLGADPDALQLPAGLSDESCAPVTNTDLARAVSDNYAVARSNAEQLDALIADSRARVDALNATP